MSGAFLNCPLSAHSIVRWCRAAVVVVALLLVPSSVPLCAQTTDEGMSTWVDETGTHKIQAKFLRIDGDNVVLQAALGKQINVPYAKLNLSSQLQAKKAEDPKAFEPPQLPSSFLAPPLAENPFPEDATIEQFLDVFLAEAKKEKADVLWHALTPEIQTEVEAIVIKAAEIAGPKFFKQVQVVLPHALTIIRNKRSFILSHPRLARRPEVVKPLSVILPAAEPVVEVLTRPATWSSENFKPGKVGPWIVAFANDMSKANKQLTAVVAQFQPGKAAAVVDYTEVTYKVIEKSTDTAKVEFEAGKAKQVLTFKKVGRTWLPTELTDNAQMGLAVARGFLEAMDQAAIDELRSNMASSLTIANGVLGSLAITKTQQEFNQLSDPWVAFIEQSVRQAMPAGRGGTPGSPGYAPPPGQPDDSQSSSSLSGT